MVPKSKKREQNIKVIKMMMIVVLGFLCTFSPIAIFNTVVEKEIIDFTPKKTVNSIKF